MSASKAKPPLERHHVTINYLEQRAPVRHTPLPTPGRKVAVMRAEKPPAMFYRYLFNGVGEAHRWVSRRYLSDEELYGHIHSEEVEIYVLYTDGYPAGFGEIDRRTSGHAAIKFFGLLAGMEGRGLGRWFFREVTDLAWLTGPGRVIIETCTLDNPRALQLYQREGFNLYDQATGVVEWFG